MNKDDSAGDWTIAEQRRLRLKTIDWTIAPAMKYVDSLSRVGGDLRAPRNRFTAYFRCVLIADRPGCDPCRHAPLNIFHCRIYRPHERRPFLEIGWTTATNVVMNDVAYVHFSSRFSELKDRVCGAMSEPA